MQRADTFQPIADPLQRVLRDVADKMIQRGVLTPQRAAAILSNPDTEPASLRTAGSMRGACPFKARIEDGAARRP